LREHLGCVVRASGRCVTGMRQQNVSEQVSENRDTAVYSPAMYVAFSCVYLLVKQLIILLIPPPNNRRFVSWDFSLGLPVRYENALTLLKTPTYTSTY
jgi:hypothetical protein